MPKNMLSRKPTQNKQKKNAVKLARKGNRRQKKKRKSRTIKLKQSCNLSRPNRRTKRTDSDKLQSINSNVNNFFGDINLNEIAKKTGYLIRNSAITPFTFLYALSMGLFGNSISLDTLALEMNSIFGTSLTGCAFSLRMGQKKSVDFLKTCFESFIAIQLKASFENKFGTVFTRFRDVILEDSTMIELNEKTRGFFKGSGGLASKSSLKLNWVFNLCRYAAISVDIYSGNTPDQKNAKKSLKYLKKGMLIIRDLGYFSFEALKQISKKGAYYLSRLNKNVCVFRNIDDREPLDLSAFLKKITAGGESAKVPVYIGREERLLVDLIVQKVPRWVWQQRIKKNKKKRDGKSPSTEFIALARYSIYITNIPDELWTNDSSEIDKNISLMIIEIYKVRWQIELLFKKFKSTIKLHIIKGQSKERVLSLIYGRLIAIMLVLMVLSYAASHTYNGREISLWKVTNWLVRKDRLANAILEGTFTSLYSDIIKAFNFVCKDRRKRKTALELVEKAMQDEKMVV